MTAWYRCLFLFSSFGPLYLVVSVSLFIQTGFSTAASFAAAAFVLSIVVFLKLKQGFDSSSPSQQRVDSVQNLDESIISYMLSYMPPLMIDDYSSLSKVAPALIFYVVLILIIFRTDSIYVNPFFLLFKYRIYKATLPSGRSVILISKKNQILRQELLALYEIQPARLFYAE